MRIPKLDSRWRLAATLLVLLTLPPTLYGFRSHDRPESSTSFGCGTPSDETTTGDCGMSGSPSGGAVYHTYRCVDGQHLAVFSDEEEVDQVACEHGCTVGEPACWDCSPEDDSLPVCRYGELERCGPDGNWQIEQQCTGPCLDGRCLLCHPGEWFCDGDWWLRCADSGDEALGGVQCAHGCDPEKGCRPCMPRCDGDRFIPCNTSPEGPASIACTHGCKDGLGCALSSPLCDQEVLTYRDVQGRINKCPGCGDCSIPVESAARLCFNEPLCAEYAVLADIACSSCGCPPFSEPLPLYLHAGDTFSDIELTGCDQGEQPVAAVYDLFIHDEHVLEILIYTFWGKSEASLYQLQARPPCISREPLHHLPTVATGKLPHIGDASSSSGEWARRPVASATGEVLTLSRRLPVGRYQLEVRGVFLLGMRLELQ